MKTLALVLAFAIAGAVADGFHGGRQGRARNGRRGGRRQSFRRGRQEGAPIDGYGAATADGGALDAYGAANEAPLDAYGAANEAPLDAYGAANGGALDDYVGAGSDSFGDTVYDDAAADGGDNNLAMLEKSVPGVPGEDYPIYAEVPETAFVCDGQVDGGYYADPEAECQVFHICTSDGQGGLSKYSFLCPNGTIFNQNYFICDWWFNFDCAEAEGLYSLNEDIAAEREAASGSSSDGSAQSSYGAPESAPVPDYQDDYDSQAASSGYESAAPAETGYGAPAVDPAAAADPVTEASLATYEADRAGRNFRGGRRNGRRNNRRRPSGGRQGRRFRG